MFTTKNLMIKKTTYLLLCILLTSCSAQWHLRKAISKDSSIFKADTVNTVDTVFLSVPKVDTVFKYRFDTVEFWKDSVRVKYFYQVEDSLVYLDVECPDNKVITKTDTVVNTVYLEPTLMQKAELFGGGILCFLFVIAVVFFLRRNRKLGG